MGSYIHVSRIAPLCIDAPIYILQCNPRRLTSHTDCWPLGRLWQVAGPTVAHYRVVEAKYKLRPPVTDEEKAAANAEWERLDREYAPKVLSLLQVSASERPECVPMYRLWHAPPLLNCSPILPASPTCMHANPTL